MIENKTWLNRSWLISNSPYLFIASKEGSYQKSNTAWIVDSFVERYFRLVTSKRQRRSLSSHEETNHRPSGSMLWCFKHRVKENSMAGPDDPMLWNLIELGNDSFLFNNMQDIQATLRQELDFVHEGHNGERCADELKHLSYVYVPKIHWDLTTKVRVVYQSLLSWINKQFRPSTTLGDRMFTSG